MFKEIIKTLNDILRILRFILGPCGISCFANAIICNLNLTTPFHRLSSLFFNVVVSRYPFNLFFFLSRTRQRPSARFSKCRHAYEFAMKARLCVISDGIDVRVRAFENSYSPYRGCFQLSAIFLSNYKS